jgi:hypothetical protein
MRFRGTFPAKLLDDAAQHHLPEVGLCSFEKPQSQESVNNNTQALVNTRFPKTAPVSSSCSRGVSTTSDIFCRFPFVRGLA